MAWNSDYVDVAERMRQFATKYPTGSIQTVSIDYKTVGEHIFIIYTAAAYRTPEDMRPGIATAAEPFPGKTNFTRDSELMNAETSAWGRCILAADPSITSKRIASANEVQNRWEPPKGEGPKKGYDF